MSTGSKGMSLGMRCKNRGRRLLSGVLLCIVLAWGLSGSPASSALSTEEQIDQVQREIDQQRERLDAALGELSTVESQSSLLNERLTALNEEAAALGAEMDVLETTIQEKSAETARLESELGETSQKEREQYERMKLRIKYMYELGGDVHLMQVLLEKNNFTEMLNRADYYREITDYDRAALEEYSRVKEHLEETKQRLEEDQDQLNGALQEKQAKQEKMQALLEETRNQIAANQLDLQAIQEEAIAYEQAIEEKMYSANVLEAQLAYEQAVKNGEAVDETEIRDSQNAAYEQSNGIYGAGYEMAITTETLDVMAAIIYCEAGGEPYEGQLAVGSVIMNRIHSGGFPNTLLGVLYQKNQFSPVMSGRFSVVLANRLATQSCYSAAMEVMSGRNVVPECLFFRTVIDGIQGTIIGNQIFY